MKIAVRIFLLSGVLGADGGYFNLGNKPYYLSWFAEIWHLFPDWSKLNNPNWISFAAAIFVYLQLEPSTIGIQQEQHEQREINTQGFIWRFFVFS